MRAPKQIHVERAYHAHVELVLLLVPGLAGVVTFLGWGGLAWAVAGMDWRPALAVALPAGTIALGVTAVVVAGAALGKEPEADERGSRELSRWNRRP